MIVMFWKSLIFQQLRKISANSKFFARIKVWKLSSQNTNFDKKLIHKTLVSSQKIHSVDQGFLYA